MSHRSIAFWIVFNAPVNQHFIIAASKYHVNRELHKRNSLVSRSVSSPVRLPTERICNSSSGHCQRANGPWWYLYVQNRLASHWVLGLGTRARHVPQECYQEIRTWSALPWDEEEWVLQGDQKNQRCQKHRDIFFMNVRKKVTWPNYGQTNLTEKECRLAPARILLGESSFVHRDNFVFKSWVSRKMW